MTTSESHTLHTSLRSLLLKTFLVSVIFFAALAWTDRDDPDPFDGGTVAYFLILAASSQLLSVMFYYTRFLLNTYPHILSNVIAFITVTITLVALLF
jgi:hypothetical protein